MKLFNRLTIASFGIVSLCVLSSCQDEDFGFTKNEIRESVYDRNFFAKYADLISPDQSWDFTPYGMMLRNKEAQGLTRAYNNGYWEENITGGNTGDGHGNTWQTDLGYSNNNYNDGSLTRTKLLENYNVPNGLTKWLDDNLPEGQPKYKDPDTNETLSNKQRYNKKFSMVTTKGGYFDIIPIYQGEAGMTWELHVVTEKGESFKDITVWHKSEDITVNGKNVGSVGGAEHEHTTKGGTNVVSPVYRIDGIEAGSTITFYLKIIHGQVQAKEADGSNTYSSAQTGREFWSDSRTQPTWVASNFVVVEPQNITFDFPDPETGLPRETKVIGVEDAFRGKNTDHVFPEIKYSGDDDCNDAVFLLIGGPDLPEVVDENELEKRYLIEDLGSLVDWDFNDIVVDFYQKIDKTGTKTQKATLRHRCGTTPFEVFLKNGSEEVKLNFTSAPKTADNYLAPEVEDVDQIDNWETTISDNIWNPKTDNIVVKVYPRAIYANNYTNNTTSGKDIEEVYTITMPTRDEVNKTGRNIAPKILAVTTKTVWTTENEEFIEKYLTNGHFTFDTEDNNGSGSGNGGGSGAGNGGSNTNTVVTTLSNTVKNMGNYDQNISFTKAQLGDIKAGDVIIIKVSGVQSGASLQLKDRNGNWDMFASFNYSDLSSGEIRYTIKDTDLSNNFSNGFVIQGKNVTVTNVAIEKTSTLDPNTTYSVSVGTATGGTANISPAANASNGNYQKGTQITLKATPDTFYEFVRWEKGGTQVATTATYSFTLDAESKAGTYTPVFNSISTTYTIGGSAINFNLAKSTYSVRVDKSNFSELAVGDQITINCSNSDGKNIYIKEMNNGWSNNLSNGNISNGKYTFSVTDAIKTSLQNNGMAIQSTNSATVTSVEISTGGGTSGNTIWNNSADITWSNAVKVSYDWSNVQVGTKLKIEFIPNQNASKVEVRFANDSWTALDGTKNNSSLNSNNDGNIELTKTDSEYTLTLTQEMINSLKNSNGRNLAICGQGFTLKKIILGN